MAAKAEENKTEVAFDQLKITEAATKLVITVIKASDATEIKATVEKEVGTKCSPRKKEDVDNRYIDVKDQWYINTTTGG